jgi:hypothetical protein
MLGELDLNMPTLSTRVGNPNAPLNSIRNYLGYSDFLTRLPIFTANYNSLQVSLNHRTNRDLSVGVAYTWSKNLTDQYTDRYTSNTYTWDPKLDYGPSGLNEPNIFVTNFVYKEPFFREQHGLTGHVLGGWEPSGITTFESGLSFNVYQYPDPYGCITPPGATSGCEAGTYPGGLGIYGPDYDIAARPDQVSPVHLKKTQTEWFTTNSFTTAQSHFGSSGVGNILSPGLEKIDLGLMKNSRLSDKISLQMRAEAFNIFNHTNFAGIDQGLEDSTFGQATGTHEPRIMQFSGKFYF